MEWLMKPVVQVLALLAALVGLISGLATVGLVIDGDSLADAVLLTLGWVAVACFAVCAAVFMGVAVQQRRHRGVAAWGFFLGAASAWVAVDVAWSGREDLLQRAFGAFGLVMALVLLISVAAKRHQAAWRTCRDCAESVKAEARVCRYCGYRFAARPDDGTVDQSLPASG